MRYFKHHTIVVTGYDDVYEVQQKAKELFDKNFENEAPFGVSLVSEIIYGRVNGQRSFFIAPDGSEESLETSHNGDNARKEFIDWLQNSGSNCDYVEVIFGGEDEGAKILRHGGDILEGN